MLHHIPLISVTYSFFSASYILYNTIWDIGVDNSMLKMYVFSVL
jgi:hypothetical protein